MPTKWTIAPNAGLLPVRFRDSSETVWKTSFLGQPERVLPGASGEKTEVRSLYRPMISYRDERVFHISVGRRTSGVVFETLDVFESDPRTVLQAFEKANRSPGFVQLGFTVFGALNISVEGFYLDGEDAYFDPNSGEQDDRIVILHAPGTLEIFDDLPKTTISFF